MNEDNEKLHNEFKSELSALLKKYKAEIMLEDFGRDWSVNNKIVVDFEYIADDRYYSQLVLGTFIN